MTGSPALNTMNAPKWAAVVSGTVWKRWGVSPSGTLAAEYVRGPLIVWAKPGSGEEDAPKIEAPKPDALALRVVELNTARQWEKVGQAARWKVRASVRWKTRQRIRRVYKLEALEAISYSALLIKRREEGKRGIVPRVFPKTRKHRREREKEGKEEALLYRLRDFMPGEEEIVDDDGKVYHTQGVEWWMLDLIEKHAREIKSKGRTTLEDVPNEAIMLACEYARIIGMKGVIREGFTVINARRVTIKLLLRALEAAEYLAHVRRRAKPAPRRGRVPRPLYARPRPPSAPLAPPVTC